MAHRIFCDDEVQTKLEDLTRAQRAFEAFELEIRKMDKEAAVDARSKMDRLSKEYTEALEDVSDAVEAVAISKYCPWLSVGASLIERAHALQTRLICQ